MRIKIIQIFKDTSRIFKINHYTVSFWGGGAGPDSVVRGNWVVFLKNANIRFS